VTTLAACVGATLLLMMAVLGARAGHAATQQAAAQMAADASALAAVAESGPYGTGATKAVARRYAEANGGRLLECACERGSSAVEVEVALGPAAARARAVIEPDLLAPQPLTFDRRGLHPRLAAAVRTLVDASGGTVSVTSGYRPRSEQQRLWADALQRYGNPEIADDWVAPPGNSMHERGLAVDLGGDLEMAVRLVNRLSLPLHRPLSNEPWHFELVGSRA
jgi:D-alanyl-D-alanine carboxypeptidase